MKDNIKTPELRKLSGVFVLKKIVEGADIFLFCLQLTAFDALDDGNYTVIDGCCGTVLFAEIADDTVDGVEA